MSFFGLLVRIRSFNKLKKYLVMVKMKNNSECTPWLEGDRSEGERWFEGLV